MNWFKKIAKKQVISSVTFYPSGSQKMTQPMTVLDVCSDIGVYGHHHSNILSDTGVFATSFEPEPGDVFEFLGDFSVAEQDHLRTRGEEGDMEYQKIAPENRLTPEKVDQLIKGYNEYRFGLLEVQLKDFSQANNGNRGYILSVVNNETQDIPPPPQLQAANDNARNLLKLLNQHGLNVDPDELAGQFSIDDFRSAINMITDYSLVENERAEDMEFNESGGGYHDFGLDQNQLQGYIQKLEQIAQWMDQNQLPDKTIIFS